MTCLRAVELTSVTDIGVLTPGLRQAVEWFGRSGIQEASGGVARYHLLDERRNLPVSTEITGYAVSALVWADAMPQAIRAADFLVRDAWQPAIAAMPFEVAKALPPSYFFDCGIITRGLLAAWRRTGNAKYLRVAREIGLSMGRDFWSHAGELHPIIDLPSKLPWPYEKRWSREPGCFQSKAAMAWANLAELFPGEAFASWWERALRYSLDTHQSFLPGSNEPTRVMDRLHAYCYFLEALLQCPQRLECREALLFGIGKVAGYLREIGPRFERSDVCAQLLRVRILAEHLEMAPMDQAAAEEEAERCQAHQRSGGSSMTDGGFGFGTKDGVPLPFMNPVSTAFAMQALEWWRQRQEGSFSASLHELI